MHSYIVKAYMVRPNLYGQSGKSCESKYTNRFVKSRVVKIETERQQNGKEIQKFI